jgi:hypothetical protein
MVKAHDNNPDCLLHKLHAVAEYNSLRWTLFEKLLSVEGGQGRWAHEDHHMAGFYQPKCLISP